MLEPRGCGLPAGEMRRLLDWGLTSVVVREQSQMSAEASRGWPLEEVS